MSKGPSACVHMYDHRNHLPSYLRNKEQDDYFSSWYTIWYIVYKHITKINLLQSLNKLKHWGAIEIPQIITIYWRFKWKLHRTSYKCRNSVYCTENNTTDSTQVHMTLEHNSKYKYLRNGMERYKHRHLHQRRWQRY